MERLPGPTQLLWSWKDAEECAVRWVEVLGFAGARRSSGGADGGVDVLGPGIVAQVKFREVEKVSAEQIRELRGCAHRGEQSIFFSKAGYTAQAVAFANEANVALYQFVGPEGQIESLNQPARRLIENVPDVRRRRQAAAEEAGRAMREAMATAREARLREEAERARAERRAVVSRQIARHASLALLFSVVSLLSLGLPSPLTMWWIRRVKRHRREEGVTETSRQLQAATIITGMGLVVFLVASVATIIPAVVEAVIGLVWWYRRRRQRQLSPTKPVSRPSAVAPAGWYPDPLNQAAHRYWTGTQWIL